jgi:hypothetical protein
MTRVVVDPGICGNVTTLEVVKLSKQKVRVKIISDCEAVTKMGESLAELDQWSALKPHVRSEVYQSASECHVHTSCPMPSAILKAIEVEAGLALPHPVFIQFEPTEPE